MPHRQLIKNYHCNPTQLPTYYPYDPNVAHQIINLFS